MIKSKSDLKKYLEQDKKANKIPSFSLGNFIIRLFSPDYIWNYILILRKYEYYLNTNKKFLQYYYKYRLNKLGCKLGFSIPANVFGPGLSIPHYGLIVVNQNAKVGRNCRLMHGVTIGATGGSAKAPKIGDNCFLGTNSVILGDITICNNVSVAANATVVKSCTVKNAMLAGTPAVLKKEHCEIWWKMNRLDL